MEICEYREEQNRIESHNVAIQAYFRERRKI